MFIITFAMEADKQRVVNGKLWLFDGHLFALQSLDGACQLAETMIIIESFWNQLHNLPFWCMNRHYGNIIGGKLGKIVEVDVDDDDTGLDEFLRIRVEINLNKLLARGQVIEYNKKNLWIPMKYEKLL